MRLEVVKGERDMVIGTADGGRDGAEAATVVLVSGWLVRGAMVVVSVVVRGGSVLVSGWLVRDVVIVVSVVVRGVMVLVSGWLAKEVREWLQLLVFRVVCGVCERDV